MWVEQALCDECGKLIYADLRRDGLTKDKANDKMRTEGIRIARGIHLCPDCSTNQIMRKHQNGKKDLYA